VLLFCGFNLWSVPGFTLFVEFSRLYFICGVFQALLYLCSVPGFTLFVECSRLYFICVVFQALLYL
jgi:hypothetical protein